MEIDYVAVLMRIFKVVAPKFWGLEREEFKYAKTRRLCWTWVGAHKKYWKWRKSGEILIQTAEFGQNNFIEE